MNERTSLKFGELLFKDRRFCAYRQGLSHLGKHHADLPRGNLHPREFPDAVQNPEFPSPARHKQIRLITGLAVERDWVILFELLKRKPFHHKPDLRRPYHPKRRQNNHKNKHNDQIDNHATSKTRLRCRENTIL